MSYKIWPWLCFLVVGVTALVPIDYEETRADHRYGDFVSDIINGTLNKVLKNISDPLRFPKISSDFQNGTLIRGGFNVSNLKIDGLKDIIASKIKYNLFSSVLNITINVPDININFGYWADVVLAELIPLYGSGRNNIYTEKNEILVNGCASLASGGGLQFKNITVILKCGGITFDLNGLIDNVEVSALVSAALNDNVATFVNSNQKLITQVISPIVESVLNDVFNPKSNLTSYQDYM